MNRKMIFGTILGLLAIIVIAAALFLPSLAQSDQSVSSPDQSVPSTDQSVASVADPSQIADPTFNSTIYAYGGSVNLQLPPGGGALANRPIDLRIEVSHVYNGAGTFFGPGDDMLVQLWVPTVNSYVPVAEITNNHNPAFGLWLKALAGVSPESFVVVSGNPDPLEVGMSGDIVTANLTVPVNINIGDPLPPYFKALNFTLPPIAIEFRPTGSAFQDYTTSMIPTTGWTTQTSLWAEPAFARVWIPQWLAGTVWKADGTMILDETVTYYSP